MDEKTLALKCAEGDAAAWSLFVARYSDFVKFIVRRAVSSSRAGTPPPPHEVDDLHDEILAWLLEGEGRVLRTYRGESKLTSWLGVVLARRVKRWVRRRDGQEGKIVSIDALSVDAASHLMEDQRDERAVEQRLRGLEKLKAALLALPERDRALLEGAFYKNQSYDELAESIGVKAASIGQLLFRAKLKLKKAVGGENFLKELSGFLFWLLFFSRGEVL